MEKVKNKKIYIRSLVLIVISFLAIILGVIVSCDYHYAGILTVLVFYIFRGKKWYLMLSQFICLYYINSKMLGGTTYEYELFGISIYYIRQKLAVLSLIPIWFYTEKQGFYNKYIKYFYYAFYPCHIVLLWLIKLVI